MDTASYQNSSDKIISRNGKEIKRSDEIVLIPIEKLHSHPDNSRKDIGNVTELADSINLQNLAEEIQTEDKDKQRRLEKELIREELRAQRSNILERAHRLRLDFIKNVNTDKHSNEIAEFASNFLLSGDIYYYTGNDEVMIKEELFSEKSTSNDLDTNPMKNLLFSSYFRYGDSISEGCIDYGYGYLANDHLQNLYNFLISIGYEISDEEQAILDGTHELYEKAEEID